MNATTIRMEASNDRRRAAFASVDGPSSGLWTMVRRSEMAPIVVAHRRMGPITDSPMNIGHGRSAAHVSSTPHGSIRRATGDAGATRS